jgi:hypothetical protein
MKRFFYISLIIQMATLPFVFGMMAGGGDSSSDDGSDPTKDAQSILSLANQANAGASDSICDYLESGEAGAGLLDNMQQLKSVTADLYGEEAFEDCASAVDTR